MLICGQRSAHAMDEQSALLNIQVVLHMFGWSLATCKCSDDEIYVTWITDYVTVKHCLRLIDPF